MRQEVLLQHRRLHVQPVRISRRFPSVADDEHVFAVKVLAALTRSDVQSGHDVPLLIAQVLEAWELSVAALEQSLCAYEVKAARDTVGSVGYFFPLRFLCLALCRLQLALIQ